MFDLRYHVASLAAVFLALAVGIILGVAISGKVRGAEDTLNAQRVAELETRLERQQELAAQDSSRLEALEAYVERTYTPLVTNRLAGESTAVVFFGSVAEPVRTAISATLRDSGGLSARTVALDMPLDPERLDDLLTSEEDLARFADDDFRSLGEEIGHELVEGVGDDALLPRVAAELVAELEGSTTAAATGVVVARSLDGLDGLSASERDATEAFVDGLVRGLRGAGMPVVGVTTTGTESREELLEWYRSSGVSSVDDLDFESGRLALALL